jgi:hypothetical protein
VGTSRHPEKYTELFSEQVIIGLIFMEGTVRRQPYVKQQQNEVISAILGRRNMDTTFIQHDGARPQTANVVLDVLRMTGSHVLSNGFSERYQCGCSWPPCSPDMNPYGHFLWDYLRDNVQRTNLHTNSGVASGN